MNEAVILDYETNHQKNDFLKWPKRMLLLVDSTLVGVWHNVLCFCTVELTHTNPKKFVMVQIVLMEWPSI